MKTQLLITVEHPDEVPAKQFIDIAIKSVLNDINADLGKGWAVRHEDIQPQSYSYEQLKEFALKCSLEHHLCNVDDLITDGLTPADILALVEKGSADVVIIEEYEYSPREDVVESIEGIRGVNLFQFYELLTDINGHEWFINFKEGK